MSRMITLGTEVGGARRKVEIDLDVLLRTRLLVQANSGGGKSWLLRRLAEQLFGKVQVLVIDREGEFASLREKEKFGYVLVGHEGDTPADIRSSRLLAERLLEHNASAVCDLYEAFRARPGDRRAWVRGFLESVLDAPKKYWRPLVVIVDEAHLFAPQETPKAASMIEREIISGCKDAMISLATVGRKRGFCLPPGQMIITDKGMVGIEKIREGDKVLTHRGRFQRVLATSSRIYNGWLVKIKSKSNATPTFSTEEHLFAVHRTHNNGAGTRVTAEVDWVAAKDILLKNRRDQTRLLTPLIAIEEPMESLDVRFDPRDRSPQTARGRLIRKVKQFSLPITSGSMRVFGWYIAEGSLGWRQHQKSKYLSKVIFNLGSHEEAEGRQLREDLGTLGLRTHVVRHGSSLRVQVASRGFAELLKNSFGEGATNKHIPTRLLCLPKAELEQLFLAYINGDGWTQRVKPYRSVATTVSSELAMELKLLGEKLGYFTSVSSGFMRSNSVIGGRAVNRHPIYSICFSALSGTAKKLAEGHGCYSVDLKERIQYHGPVYDLQVEEDQSFCTTAHVVHNCAIWATQRLAKLDKDASSELFNRLVGMTIEDVDVDRAADLMSVSRDEKADFKKSLKTLDPGLFYAFGRAICSDRRLIKIGPVQTTHPEPGSAKHAAGPPPPPEKVKAFLPKLADLPKEAETRAKSEEELRAEVRALKTELAVAKRAQVKAPAPASPSARPAPAAPPKLQIVKVDVPVVKEVEIKRLEAALTRAEKLQEKLKGLGDPVVDAAKELRTAIGAVLAVDSGRILEAKTRKLQEGLRPRLAPLPAAPPARAPRHAAPAVQAAAQTNGEDGIPRPQAAVLKALLELEALGIAPVSREQLAGWLGITVSGSFRNYLGNLRTRGYVDYKENNDVVITDEGRRHAPVPDTFDSPDLVLHHCLSVLPGPQGTMLRAIHAVHPEWLSREDLAAELGVTISGSFRNYLGSLHTDGMVEYGTGDRKNLVRCPDWMFLLQIAS